MESTTATVPPFPQTGDSQATFVAKCVEGFAALLQNETFVHRSITVPDDTASFVQVLHSELRARLGETVRIEVTQPGNDVYVSCTIWA